MRRAIALAVLSVASGWSIGAGAASATLVCPAGVSPPSVYCAEVTPPAVTSEAATEVTSTSAVLKGTVNTFGAATTYWFEYGTTTAYGSKTPEGSLPAAPGQPASATISSVSAAVGGLASSTTYHFRLAAKNAGGVNFGADQTFTTANATGLALLKVVITTPVGAHVVIVPLHCARKPRCTGRLLLLRPVHKASAARVSTATGRAAATVYGSANYSISYGHDAQVRVPLTAAAIRALARHGSLTVAVLAVADGRRTTIGTVTIKAATRPRHVSHAERRPGFTG